MDPFSLAAPANAGVLTVTPNVSDKVNWDPLRENGAWFATQVTSGLSLQQYVTCQGDPANCTNPAALPATDPNDPP